MMEDLSLHILDLAENATAAGARWIAIAINEDEQRNILTIRVEDDGAGMTAEERARALDPFFTTKHKKTGLGLALLAQTAGQCGGKVVLDSAPMEGTKVEALFRYHHIDRPPLTRMAETLMMLAFGHPEIDFRYSHRRNGRVFRFESRRFLRQAGRGPVWTPLMIEAVGKALRGGLRKIGAE